MKKLYPLAILIMVMAVILSACAPPAAPAESGEMAGEMDEEVTINIITAQGPLADGLVALIPAFEEENPGIKIEVTPFPWTNFFEKVISLARTSSGEFDVIFADDPWMPNIVDGGLSVNLTEEYGATPRRRRAPGLLRRLLLASPLWPHPRRLPDRRTAPTCTRCRSRAT